MASKKFHELMGIIKYGNDEQREILLKAILMEKSIRDSKKKITKIINGD